MKLRVRNAPIPYLRFRTSEIQDILDISQPTAYALVKKNCFHSVRVGNKIRVSKKSFDEWLDQEIEGGGGASE